MNRKAYAKINLSLDILGKRSDGYHEIDTIMQTVGLCDDVDVKINESGIIGLSMTAGLKTPAGLKPVSESEITSSAGENTPSGGAVNPKEDIDGIKKKETAVIKGIPLDSGNLAYRAAEIFFKTAFPEDKKKGADITLIKRIPSGAGLGGGSSDAAAVLTLLNDLHGGVLSRDRLIYLAASLGTDVPFFIDGGAARARGIGTKLKPLCSIGGKFFVLIAKPSCSNPTAAVYKGYDSAVMEGKINLKSPDNDALEKALKSINELSGRQRAVFTKTLSVIRDNNINVLEYPGVMNADIIASLREYMIKNGAFTSCMSGSGSSVYGLFLDEDEAGKAAAGLSGKKIYGNLEAVIKTTTI